LPEFLYASFCLEEIHIKVKHFNLFFASWGFEHGWPINQSLFSPAYTSALGDTCPKSKAQAKTRTSRGLCLFLFSQLNKHELPLNHSLLAQTL
jgi:hypothetical protein